MTTTKNIVLLLMMLVLELKNPQYQNNDVGFATKSITI